MTQRGLNKVMLIGRLGKDPETRNTPSGATVCNFTVATSEQFKGKDGNNQEKTEWHRIVTFGKLAEICGKYLTKGAQVYVEGRLQTRSWEQDGVTRYATEIVADNMQMIGGKSEHQEQRQEPPRQEPAYTGPSVAVGDFDDSDDIPF